MGCCRSTSAKVNKPADTALDCFSESGCTELVIRDICLDDVYVAKVAQALAAAPGLSTLTLSHTFLDDLQCQKLLAAVPKNPPSNLNCLDLGSNYIDEKACKELGSLLDSCWNCSLVRLVLYDNGLSSAAFEKFASPLTKCQKLRCLSLGYNSLGDKGVVKVAEAVETLPALGQLDVSRCGIRELGVSRLASALTVSTSLTSLSLSHTNLSSAAADALALGLRGAMPVAELDLRFCGSAVAEPFAAVLSAEDATLQRLLLAGCELGAEVIEPLASALGLTHCKLRELDLSINHLRDKGAGALAKALRTNTALECLNLSRNSIGDFGAESMAEAMHVNCILKCLDLSKNSILVLGLQKFVDACKHNIVVEELYLDAEVVDETLADVIHNQLLTNKQGSVAALSLICEEDCVV